MTVDIDTREPEVNPKGPPLEWYEGRGPEGEGIEMIFPSQKFIDLGGGEVGEQLSKWSQYLGDALVLEGDDWRPAREASEMPDDNPLKQQTVHAEQVIRLETGFSPRQIMDRKTELLGVFKGQVEAPFPVFLWPQREQ